MHSVMITKLFDFKMLDAFLNSLNLSSRGHTERQVTAIVAMKRNHTATENQIPQRHKHSVGGCTNHTVIKVLLASRSYGDLVFQ